MKLWAFKVLVIVRECTVCTPCLVITLQRVTPPATLFYFLAPLVGRVPGLSLSSVASKQIFGQDPTLIQQIYMWLIATYTTVWQGDV